MKFYIFMCFTAYLLTGISSRLRRTTPMSSAVLFNDADARQVRKFAEIIDFVNSASNNDVRRYSLKKHGPSKRQHYRRLNEMMSALNAFADFKMVRDVDTQAAFKEIQDKVRYHIIDNPDVLMEYRAKKKDNNITAVDHENTPFDPYKFSTAANKLNDNDPEVASNKDSDVIIYKKPNVTRHRNAAVHLRAQEDVEELTTDQTIYRPSFPKDEDDDKPITDDKEVTKKENNKPKIDVEDPVVLPEIYKTDKFEKRTQNNIPSIKENKTQIEKKKADATDLKDIATKKEDKNEYRSTKFIYSHEKLNEDSIRPKNNDNKINKEYTNENTGTDKNQKERSWDRNENNLTSVERLILKVDNKINDNRDQKEQYSIYAHKERRENSNRHSKKSHEVKERYDKKKKDEYHDNRAERESQWIKVDSQNDYKESLRNKKDDKLSQKEKDRDSKYEKWNTKEKELDSNYDSGSKGEKKLDNDDKWSQKEKDRSEIDERWNEKGKSRQIDKRWNEKEKSQEIDKRWNAKEKNREIDKRWNKKEKTLVKTDAPWTKKEKYWNNNKRDDDKDKAIDTMEYEWNKRHQEYDKHKSDAQWEYSDSERNEKNFEERDNDFKNRDNEFNKRDNDWTKRDSEGNKNIGRTNDRNESGNKKSYENVDNDKEVRHDRYKIVDRPDSDSSRYDDFERSFRR